MTVTFKNISLAYTVLPAAIFSMFVQLPAAAEPPPETRWDPWFQAGVLGSNDLHRAETELFLPLGDEDDIFFLDLRGNYMTDDFDDLELEGNFMAGWRHMLDRGVNVGLWVGGDGRRMESDNSFWQVSMGAEVLHPDWDMRFNGYVPITDPKRADRDSVRVKLSGNRIYMHGGREVPMAGFDGEVGWRMPLERLGLERDVHEFRIYAGGFYFTDDDALRDIAGPRGRLEWQWLDVIPGLPGSRLVATTEVQWDKVRDVRVEGGLHLRIPFTWGFERSQPIATAHTRQSRRMTERVIRDVDIVVSRSGKEDVEDALTDVRFDRVAWVTPNGGNEIATASAAAGPNSLLIANGDFAGQKSMGGHQTLQGGGSMIEVRGTETGATGWFTASGAPASITYTGDDAVLRLNGTRAHVAGFSLWGGGGVDSPVDDNDGIYVAPSDFIGAFTYLSVREMGQDGIHLRGLDDDTGGDTYAIFRNVLVDDVGSTGLYVRGGNVGSDRNRVAHFRNVMVSNTGYAGIDIGGGGEGDRIGHFEYVWVRNTGYAGIDIGGGGGGDRIGHFEHVWVRNTGAHGIAVGGGGGGDRFGAFEHVWVENTGINGSGAGIEITGGGAGNRIGTFDDVTVIDAGGSNGHGIDIGGGGEGDRIASFRDVHVSESAETGIQIGGGGDGDRIGRFENVRVSGSADSGIEIAGGGAGARVGTFDDVEVTDSGEFGIEMGGGGAGTRTGTFENVAIADTGGDAIFFDSEGTVEATFDDVTVAGTVGDGDDALIETESAPTTFNGTVDNQTTNGPALCKGAFTGTIDFTGVDAATITDGVGCL